MSNHPIVELYRKKKDEVGHETAAQLAMDLYKSEYETKELGHDPESCPKCHTERKQIDSTKS